MADVVIDVGKTSFAFVKTDRFCSLHFSVLRSEGWMMHSGHSTPLHIYDGLKLPKF